MCCWRSVWGVVFACVCSGVVVTYGCFFGFLCSLGCFALYVGGGVSVVVWIAVVYVACCVAFLGFFGCGC